ncbi:MAG TPA: hypothetical protein ENN67_01665, partial [Firmicutes bacterium]|nr:hypothetical protein [Bacillota bacterium]
MPLNMIIKVAVKSLYANKLRSFLAMLGIIIGVGAVISMLAIGTGAKQEVMSRIAAMGTRLLIVRPGQIGMRGVMSGPADTLTIEDGLAIIEEVKGVEQVSPMTQASVQAKYLNNNVRTNVAGVAVTYPSIRNYTVEHGRFFSEAETLNRAKVAVLGSETALQLQITPDRLGEKIKISGINFEVIGILKSKGSVGFFNPDEVLLIPYTT